MNERIRQLAEQSFDITKDNRDRVEYSADNYGIEKFAKLIIEDCIDCIRGAGLTDEAADRNNLGFNDGISAAVINTQKHFGVEE
jgi:hypothetical protein